MSDRLMDWREVLALLHRRRRPMALVFAATLAALSLVLLLLGPRYEVTATLLVTAERATPAVSPDNDVVTRADPVSEEEINSEIAMLQSKALLREVLAKEPDPRDAGGAFHVLKAIVLAPIEAPAALYRLLHGLPAPTPLDELTRHAARRLDVSAVHKSNLIEVRYAERSIDPAWLARVVNDLVARHIERHQLVSQQLAAQQFFGSQRQLLADRAKDAQDALVRFHQREDFQSTPEQREMWRRRLADLTTALATTESELAEATGKIDFLVAELARHPRTIPVEESLTQNQAMQFLKPRVMEKRLERSHLLSTYAPGSLKVQDVERELAEAERLMRTERAMITESRTAVNPTHQTLEVQLAETHARYAALHARAESLGAQAQQVRAAVEHLETVGAEQDRLEQDVAATRDSLRNYSRKEEDARVARALDESRIVNVAIARAAEAPPTPADAHGLLIFLLALLMSAAAGSGAAVLRDVLDPAVQTAAEASRLTGIPILAEVG